MHEDSTGQFPKAPEQQQDPYGSIVCWENSMGFTCVEGSKGNETLPSAPETPIPGWMLGISGLVGAIAEWWYTPAPTQLHEGSDLGMHVVWCCMIRCDCKRCDCKRRCNCRNYRLILLHISI